MNPNLVLVAFGSMSFSATQIAWIDFAAFTDISDNGGNVLRRNVPCVEVKLLTDRDSYRLTDADRDQAMIWKANAQRQNNSSVLATFGTKSYNLATIRQINANGLTDEGQDCYEIVQIDPTAENGLTVWKLTGNDAREASEFFTRQAQASLTAFA